MVPLDDSPAGDRPRRRRPDRRARPYGGAERGPLGSVRGDRARPPARDPLRGAGDRRTGSGRTRPTRLRHGVAVALLLAGGFLAPAARAQSRGESRPTSAIGPRARATIARLEA